MVRSFDDLLQEYSAVFGLESDEKVMTAFMAAQPEHPIILEFLSRYAGKTFDAAAAEPNTVLLTDVLTRRGLALQNRMQRYGTNDALLQNMDKEDF